MVLEGAWATNNIDKRYRITDVEAFAKELARELNKESEDGTTPIHALFDGVIEESISPGASGIEEHPQQEH